MVALVNACAQYKARSILSNSDEVLNRSIPSRKKRLKRRRRQGDRQDGDDRAMIVVPQPLAQAAGSKLSTTLPWGYSEW